MSSSIAEALEKAGNASREEKNKFNHERMKILKVKILSIK